MAVKVRAGKISTTVVRASRPEPAPFVLTSVGALSSDPSLVLVVIGKNDAEVAWFDEHSRHARDECRLMLVSNPGMNLGGYAAIVNPVLDAGPEDVVGVVHADTSFAPGALRLFARAAVVDKGRIVGMVGRSPSAYVWSRATPRHGQGGGGFVSTLDCCSVFVPRRLGMRVDGVNFDDFHLVVEDLCLQARARGIPSFVPSAEAEHHEADRSAGRPQPGWMEAHARYLGVLRRKWGADFYTT